MGLSQALARVLPDPRDPERITHPLLTFVRQRLYGLCLGYEDLNDHDHLRLDLAWQTAAERDQALASRPTLCRWENRADQRTAWLVQEILVEQFIRSFAQAPEELMLDLDSTGSGARETRGEVFSRLLRGLLFFAALRLLRGAVAGVLSTAE